MCMAGCILVYDERLQPYALGAATRVLEAAALCVGGCGLVLQAAIADALFAYVALLATRCGATSLHLVERATSLVPQTATPAAPDARLLHGTKRLSHPVPRWLISRLSSSRSDSLLYSRTTAPGLSADQGGLAVDLRGEDTPHWMGGRPCVQHFLSEQACMYDAWVSAWAVHG